jgi:hypothetical protein
MWWYLRNLRDEIQVAVLLWRLRRRASSVRSAEKGR